MRFRQRIFKNEYVLTVPSKKEGKKALDE